MSLSFIIKYVLFYLTDIGCLCSVDLLVRFVNGSSLLLVDGVNYVLAGIAIILI